VASATANAFERWVTRLDRRDTLACYCIQSVIDILRGVPARHELPDDVESLKQLLHEQQAQILEQQRLLLERKIEIARLQLQVAQLRRLKFGRSSEQLDSTIQQLELTLEELEATRTQIRPRPSSADRATESDSPTRQALPDHLPREDRQVPSPCSCPGCGGELRYLGQDVSEQLAMVPERLKVIRHIREKFSCAACDTIVQAPAPSRPLARSNADASLLAHVLVSKYCDHLPLYRQSEIHARAGVQLSRSTLADWVGGAAQLLTPLAEAVRVHVLGADKVHGDDTPIRVLSPGRGTTKEGRLWIYANDDRPAGNERPPAVWFTYTPDRKQAHPQEHLRNFHGVLQCDGYEGFERLCDRADQPEPQRIRLASCWAHARRKFFDIHEAQRCPIAFEALERIGALYDIEHQIRGRPPDKRAAARQVRAGPLLEDLRAWLMSSLSTSSKKSALAVAIRYALTRWPSLTAYVKDGRIEIDNSAAERALRGVALGRKNFLFVGSDAGGERAAVIYTLVESAKLYGLDPEDYLRRVLERIADHPIARVAELLPWNLTGQSVSTAQAA
jgi:transposase